MTAELHDHLAAYVNEVKVPDNLLAGIGDRAARLRRRRRSRAGSVTLLTLILAFGGVTLTLPSHRNAPAGQLTESGAPAPATTEAVALTVRPVGDQSTATPAAAQLALTEQILRKRLAADGLARGKVTLSGTTLTVSAPGGTQGAALATLVRPGVLLIRQVAKGCAGLAEDSCVVPDPRIKENTPDGLAQDLGPLPAGDGPITWTHAQATSAFASLECGRQAQQLRVADFTADSWALGCGSSTSPSKYLLQPAAVAQHSIASVRVSRELTNAGNGQLPTPYYEVDLTFADASYTRLTQSSAGGVIQNAFTLDGTVITAPVNESAVVGGAQITGSFTRDAATLLGAELVAGPLPLKLIVVDAMKSPSDPSASPSATTTPRDVTPSDFAAPGQVSGSSTPATGSELLPSRPDATIPITTEPAATVISNPTSIAGVVAYDTSGHTPLTTGKGDGRGLRFNHVTGPVIYSVTPPVGGDHNATWMNCGVYDAPVPSERAVHDLEHGAVWITYEPTLPAHEVAQLRAFVEAQTMVQPSPGVDPQRYMDLSPWQDNTLGSPIVLSAWGFQLKVTSPTDPRMQQFIDTFRTSATYTPELGASCDGQPVNVAGQPSVRASHV